jgi:gas vesicle protein
MSSKFRIGMKGFIIGGAIGSILTFLFTPKTGEELRNDIGTGAKDYLDKARVDGKKILDDIVNYANQLRALTAKYAESLYSGPTDRIETEIKSLRNALNASIDVYRTKGKAIHSPKNDKLVNNISSEFENEALPKIEGMKRRKS